MMIFVTGALTAAVWLAQSLRLVDLIVNRGLSAEMFLYLALLILPRFLDIVLPIGAFIAVLFVFNRLMTESELVVMRACGLVADRPRLAGPGPERHRVSHPDDALRSISCRPPRPRVQGPAIRDPQPLHLELCCRKAPSTRCPTS